MSNFIKVFDSIAATGAASFNITTGELNPEIGYMVSLTGYEKKVPVPIGLGAFQEAVSGYYDKRIADLLEGRIDLYIGFWIYNRELYMDISQLVYVEDTAVRLALANNQLAIFDNKNKVSVFVKDNSEKLIKGFLAGLVILATLFVLAVGSYIIYLKYHL